MSILITYNNKSSLGPFLKLGFGPFAFPETCDLYGLSCWVDVPLVVLNEIVNVVESNC